MRAIVISKSGGPDMLRMVEQPMPEPRDGEVRLRVLAAGVNRADLLQRQGLYPVPRDCPADVPGLEVAGVVDSRGPGAKLWQVGQRVFGVLCGGGYADYVVTHERHLVEVPKNLSDVEAAAVPEAFITAHDALCTQGGLVPGERVLIHAVGSGVGTAAVQLVRALGATSYGTARSPEKLRRACDLGLTEALPQQHWAAGLAAATGGEGVHLVIDFIGGAYTMANLQALTVRGRLVQVGTLSGANAAVDLVLLLTKRLRIIGTVLRSRSIEEKAEATRLFARVVIPLLESGNVRPVLDRVFPLEQAADAHRYVGSNKGFGKVVLTP